MDFFVKDKLLALEPDETLLVRMPMKALDCVAPKDTDSKLLIRGEDVQDHLLLFRTLNRNTALETDTDAAIEDFIEKKQ